MASITQQGMLNTTALVVPDLYVQIVPPQTLNLNGVPSNVIGVVGTASWGPVGTPITVGTMADYMRSFGAVQARKYDMGTAVAVAVQQGAAAFRCVRVTDGTDTAAVYGQISGGQTAIVFTARYTGSAGNLMRQTFNAGSAANTVKLTIFAPFGPAEVFDNIPGTGNALWVNMAAAVNQGQGALRGPSAWVTAAAGPATGGPPTYGSIGAFMVGTDGAANVSQAVLIGADTTPRTGMYALRNTGASIGLLADCDDPSQWSTADAFGLAEGLYMVQALPAGMGIDAAVAAKRTAGIDSYGTKVMHGDWLTWDDRVNGVRRLVSPAAFAAGRLANLSPEQSGLNKPLYSIVGSQRSTSAFGSAATYSAAELAVLIGAGIDVITNPIPAGAIWGLRAGHNSSTNPAVQGDNYTRMTNYIAATLAAGMGVYVGQVINADLFRRVRATQLTFLQAMLGQGMLGSIDGTLPYAVKCDAQNNPIGRTSLGYLQSDAQVQYQAINEKFLVNVEGGQTVKVSSASGLATNFAAA